MITSFTSFIESLNKKRIILIFSCIGMLIYGNSLFNNFVGDDFGLVKNNKTIRSVMNIPSFFGQGAFYEGDVMQRQQVNYYRPVTQTTYSIIYFFSRDHAFGFHFIQVIIHIINSLLIYFIINRFFGKKSSFFLALIFLTHPFNNEAVVYISALQEPLFVFFGLLAFSVSMRKVKSLRNASFITALLTASLLSKEAGAVFLLVVPLFSYFYNKQSLLRAIAPSITALLIYMFLRFVVAQIYFPQSIIVPIMTLSLWERLVHIPGIIFFYISTFVYPNNLFVFQSWTIKMLTFKDFYLPLFVDVGLFSGIFMFGIVLYKRHQDLFKAFLFFFLWFFIGLGIHLQIIPLDQTVADRWFYFPMIGLLGLIGLVIKYINLHKRLNPNLIIPIILIIIIAFSVRVFTRNATWKDPLTLYTHDLKYDQNSFQLEADLGREYFRQKNYRDAEIHDLRAIDLFPNVNTFASLAVHYMAANRYADAEKAFETALKHDPNHVSSWVYLAICKHKLGKKEDALATAKKAYSLSPSKSLQKLILIIQFGKQINIQ